MGMKWTSRKFLVSVVSFITATGLLIAGLIDMANWQWMSSITVGAYLASQGIADAVAALKQ